MIRSVARSLLWLPLLLGAARADDLSVDSSSSVVRFHVGYALHKVDGEARAITGRARLAASGPTQVMLRIPALSFTTGNSNRDAHMREVIEPARHPAIELKAVVPDFPRPTSFPATVEIKAPAQVAFHGVRQTIEVAVRLVFTAADRVHASSRFTLRMSEFQVARPSLMFVPIDDDVKLEAEIDFRN